MKGGFKYWLGGVVMIMLGMVFIVAASGKLLAGFSGFDLYAFPAFVPPVISKAIYYSLPYIELIVGILLVIGISVRFVAGLSLMLVAGFAVSNILMIIRGAETCANCFGLAGSFTPTASLFLDGIMALMIAIIFWIHRGKFFNLTPWVMQSAPEMKYV